MLTLLFAVVYWWAMIAGGFSALFLLVLGWFLIDDWLHPVDREPRPVVRLERHDPDDPLERLFALPAAERQRRVR